MFRVGEELLGPRRLEVRQPAEEGKNKRHHSQIMENIVDRLNQARDIKAGEILQDVGGGKDSKEGVWQILNERKETAFALAQANEKSRGKPQHRGANKSIVQKQQLKTIALLQAARRASTKRGGNGATTAELRSLELFDLDMDRTLSNLQKQSSEA